MSDPCDLAEDVVTLSDARTEKISAFTVEQLALSNETTYSIAVLIASTLNLTNAHVDVRGGLFSDTISLTTAVSQPASVSNNSVENINISTVLATWLRDLRSDTISLANASQATISNVVQSSITLSTVVVNPLSASQLVAERLVLSDVAAQYMVSYVSESLALTSVAAQSRSVVNLVSEAVQLTSTALQTVDTTQLVTDRLTWATAHADELSAVQTIVDEIELTTEFYAPGGGAWTALAETWGMSRYDNMPLNSITSHNGVLYAGAEDGLYRLSGADDHGTKISAEVDTGIQNFTDYLKRAAYAYAGYTSDGTIALRVTGAPAGLAETYTAAFEKIRAGFEIQNRVKLGRGMRSGYWKFAVINQSGADFRLDRLRIIFEDASRKV